MSFEGFFLFFFLLWRQFCSADWTGFSNFDNGSLKKHFCEIILKSVHWSMRKCHLNVFLFLALVTILFSEMEIF